MEENNMRPTKQPGIYCFDQHGLGLECFFKKTQKKPKHLVITKPYRHSALPPLKG